MHINKLAVFAFVSLFTLLIKPSNAQFLEGFAGRKTVLKTDIIKGNGLGFRNLDMEVLLFHNFSFTVGYRKYSSKNPRLITVSNFQNSNKGNIKVQREDVNFGILDLSARYYFSTPLTPSPHAFYFFMSHGRGNGTIKGKLGQTIYNGPTNYFETTPFSINNVSLRNYQLGFGRQSVLSNHFTIDCFFSIGVNKLKSTNNKDIVERLKPIIGEHFHVLNFGIFEPPIKSSESIVAYFFHLKIGYMIF